MTTASRKFGVITGGSSGMGLAFARQFLTHDFDILIAAERTPRCGRAPA